MKSRAKLYLKTAWLTAAIVILLMGTNLCVSTDRTCFDAGETMFFLMFWLSFPTGMLFVFVATFVVASETVHYPSSYFTFWFMMACGGYLQWFVVIPRLFAKSELTIINLRGRDLPEKNLDVNAQCSKRERKSIKPITAFDKQGRTPLERVILFRS